MNPADTELDSFFLTYPQHSFATDALLIDEQEEPKGVYYLQHGHVRQFIISEEGEELSLHIFEEGSFFPMMWAISNIPNRHAYAAMDDVVVRIAPANEFQTFLLSQPELLFRFSQRLLHGLNGMLLRVESLSLQNAKKRVISILLYLARHFGEQQGQQLILRPYFTHQELATFIGLARETTSIEISKLEKQGLIAYQESSFVILDPARLEAELHR